jgi:hypothetical protein
MRTREQLSEDGELFLSEVEASGQAPFDHLTAEQRRRAALRVVAARPIAPRRLSHARQRLRPPARRRGAGRPRARRVTRSANSPPGEADEPAPPRAALHARLTFAVLTADQRGAVIA